MSCVATMREASPYYERDGVAIYCGDCRDVLRDRALMFDLVVTDPPYTFGMASTMHEGKAGGWGDMMNGAMLYAEILRLCRPALDQHSGAAWVFNSWRSLPVLMRASFDVRWPIESLMVWDKQWIGPGGQRGLRPSYELAALFVSPGFKIENRGLPDIWPCKYHPASRKTGHPAEKPVALMRRMIEESKPSVAVLDPFCGSGSTLVAAKLAGISSVGVEVEERYCEIAAKRLDAIAKGEHHV